MGHAQRLRETGLSSGEGSPSTATFDVGNDEDIIIVGEDVDMGGENVDNDIEPGGAETTEAEMRPGSIISGKAWGRPPKMTMRKPQAHSPVGPFLVYVWSPVNKDIRNALDQHNNLLATDKNRQVEYPHLFNKFNDDSAFQDQKRIQCILSALVETSIFIKQPPKRRVESAPTRILHTKKRARFAPR